MMNVNIDYDITAIKFCIEIMHNWKFHGNTNPHYRNSETGMLFSKSKYVLKLCGLYLFCLSIYSNGYYLREFARLYDAAYDKSENYY